jgi:excisionase family DNA binding protein
MDDRLVYSVMELASVLHIGRNAAYALIKNGDIRCVRIGRTIRVPRSALLEYLERAA